MSWQLIALAVAAPTLAGLLVVVLIRAFSDEAGVGTAIGAGVILAMGLGLFGYEYIDLARIHEACFAANRYCPTFPGDFDRYSLVAMITFIDVGLLYVASLLLDEWRRRVGRRLA